MSGGEGLRLTCDRRRFGAILGGLSCAAALRANEPAGMWPPIGFSLYGMKSLGLIEAVKACAEIGYECVELPVMADWPADTATFNAAKQAEYRSALTDARLSLTAIMENLPILVDGDAAFNATCDRLRRACETARTLSPEHPIPVETVLGGAPNAGEETDARMADRLLRWAKIAEDTEVTLAIKAHVGNTIRTPERLVRLLEKVNHPRVRAAYDCSHFIVQGISPAESWKSLEKQTEFVHVKDVAGTPEKFRFLLPGEGTDDLKIDYAALFRMWRASNYRRGIIVEVSGQIHSRAGYDPLAAARKSFAVLSAARAKASD